MKTKAQQFGKQAGIWREHGGLLRTSQALRLGIHPRDLYAMRAEGVLEEVGRGLYHLAGMPQSQHDLTAAALKVPRGVICLISALDFHNLTTQIPHRVWMAIKFPSVKPKIDYPPMQFVWMSDPAFKSGIETHKSDGIELRIYSVAKTVADCFKFRNKVGIDVALEALKTCRSEKRCSVDELLKYAKVCRVEKVVTPYLEALL